MAINPVKLMFSVAKEFGTSNSVHARKGFSDRQSSYKNLAAINGREINVYSRIFGFEYRFQVRMQPDPIISQMDVKTDIWRTPYAGTMPDECAVQNIDYELSTMFAGRRGRDLDRYFTEGSAEKVLTILANQNREFREMVKKFNTLVTEPMPVIEVKITFVSMNEFQERLSKILATMKQSMTDEQKIRTFECLAVEITRMEVDRSVQDKMFEELKLSSEAIFPRIDQWNDAMIRIDRIYKDRTSIN